MKSLSRLGYGCVRLTSCRNLSDAQTLINKVLASNIRYFDTAPAYGQGYSEKILGTCLTKSLVPREEYIISTKLGTWPHGNTNIPTPLALRLKQLARKVNRLRAGKENAHGLNYPNESVAWQPAANPTLLSLADARNTVEKSLKALKTDYLDILLLHELLPSSLTDKAKDYLFTLRTQGIINRLGIAANGSNYLSHTQGDFSGWDVLQYEYGANWPAHDTLKNQFPLMHHVIHSCVGKRRFGDLLPTESLKKTIQQFPQGTVLFSSLNPEHIRQNALIANIA
ncbi:aldo/keto reductase [Synechococcus sp. EJ6-Ellesmere]|uniref:aldo/keto reductase n=1 Tax=Synechococcus sp. EJ6-Ellesmere TaxID=2823734 RepID=UPI0020CB82E6|nr:aldo/keto reductase [Synechococcus sp. EJ6-Ellesmere]MCP9825032.1 aldo/keto reductase [Synechococcus sp. EJ6-Ellesmere]